jgi:hypothetical protein
MSATREVAIAKVDSASKMGRAGRQPNVRDQEGCSSSSMTKEEILGHGRGLQEEGWSQKVWRRVWSEPRESAKDTMGREKGSPTKASSLARNRSRTNGHCPLWPVQVGTWGGKRRERPEASNQSSRVAAHEEVVAYGINHEGLWVLKSPNTVVGTSSLRSQDSRLARPCSESGTS